MAEAVDGRYHENVWRESAGYGLAESHGGRRGDRAHRGYRSRYGRGWRH
jgi:hypothetical protein